MDSDRWGNVAVSAVFSLVCNGFGSYLIYEGIVAQHLGGQLFCGILGGVIVSFGIYFFVTLLVNCFQCQCDRCIKHCKCCRRCDENSKEKPKSFKKIYYN